MSVIFKDGFDHYQGAMVLRKWDSVLGTHSSGTANARRATSAYLDMDTGGSYTYFISKDVTGTPNTIAVGLALRINLAVDGHRGFCLMRGGSKQATVVINDDRSISVKRGDYNGTVLESTAAGVFPLSAWTYVEFKIYVHDSAGTYDVYLNGVSVLDGTGVDTKGQADAGVDAVQISSTRNVIADDFWIDDLYIDDAAVHGDRRIDTLWPDGAGNYAQFTPNPSGTDNDENVDDGDTIDDDATFNSSSDVNEIDSFSFDDLVALGGTIDSIAVNICAQKDDSGSRELTPLLRISGADYLGDAIALLDDWKIHQHIWENPPSDPSVEWEESDVNGTEPGYKLTG